jgi:glycosyltransferase involved in cell wall biosynthesis
MRKKKVLFHSDFAMSKTGFGRAAKATLAYLYKTKKYELYHLCCGSKDGGLELTLTPWKSIGTITPQIAAKNGHDQDQARKDSYGETRLDEIIKEIKPDIYIGVQDFWGVEFSIGKYWFKKITSAIWTTLDSLPILKSARDRAPDIKNYWVWSNFAEKALHEEGFKHVQTMHGPIDCSKFSRLSNEKRQSLRAKHGIPKDAFIVGFVFRNQLRKLVPNLMEGYKKWKDAHPEVKNTYLLLHTGLTEGWNIPEQAKIHGIDNKEILVTYICKKCGAHEVKSFDDRGEDVFLKKENGQYAVGPDGKRVEKKLETQNKDCPHCKTQKSQSTTSAGFGITEIELNEIYNLMDVYVHPFTSGGQEIPIQEAKLTELITLVTNYSCGEESCEPEAASLPLQWAKYLEHGTEFIKASTYPESIKEQLDVFWNMSADQRSEMGKKARKWVLENFAKEKIGQKIEKFIDEAPFVDENDETIFCKESPLNSPNPEAVIQDLKSDLDWILLLYKLILDRPDISEKDDGVLYWMNEISKGAPRQNIEKYFRNIAKKEIEKKEFLKKDNSLESFLLKNNKKRILFTIPKSLGDCFLCTAIFEPLREIYPKSEWDLYVTSEPQYQDVFLGNEHITKWLPFAPPMESTLAMEGAGDNKGYFDICFCPHFGSQKTIDYVHNGLDKLLM